jgi:hypothetical protein
MAEIPNKDALIDVWQEDRAGYIAAETRSAESEI